MTGGLDGFCVAASRGGSVAARGLSGGGEPAGAVGAVPPAVRKAARAVSVWNKSVSSLRLAAVTSKAA